MKRSYAIFPTLLLVGFASFYSWHALEKNKAFEIAGPGALKAAIKIRVLTRVTQVQLVDFYWSDIRDRPAITSVISALLEDDRSWSRLRTTTPKISGDILWFYLDPEEKQKVVVIVSNEAIACGQFIRRSSASTRSGIRAALISAGAQ